LEFERRNWSCGSKSFKSSQEILDIRNNDKRFLLAGVNITALQECLYKGRRPWQRKDISCLKPLSFEEKSVFMRKIGLQILRRWTYFTDGILCNGKVFAESLCTSEGKTILGGEPGQSFGYFRDSTGKYYVEECMQVDNLLISVGEQDSTYYYKLYHVSIL